MKVRSNLKSQRGSPKNLICFYEIAGQIIGGTNLANIQSQIKRNRQNEKRRLRNRDFRGAARSAVKDALAAMTAGADSQAAIATALSALDKAAQKGAIHQRNAARRKSRLIKRLSALGQRPAVGAPPGTGDRTSEAAQTTPKSAKRGASATQAKTKPEAKKPTAKTPAKKATAKKTTKK